MQKLITANQSVLHGALTINRAQYSGTQIGREFASREIGTNCVARNGRKTKLFWGKISGRASTSRHFLRIGFLIIPIISNTCIVIRPICAIFRLGALNSTSYAAGIPSAVDLAYRVQPGDNLSKLTRDVLESNTSWEKVAKYNNLKFHRNASSHHTE